MSDKYEKLKPYIIIIIYIVIYCMCLVLFKEFKEEFVIISNVLQTLPPMIVTLVLFNIYKNRNLIKELRSMNEKLEIEVEKRTKELYDMAYTDFLTRLPNRRALDLEISEILEGKEDSGNCIGALMILDIDKFKLVNDTYGHTLGDAMLKTIGRKLQELKGGNLSIFRQGADEFAILLGDIDRKEELCVIIEKILNKISEPICLNGHRVYITCSAGIATYPDCGIDSETLIRNAERGLHHSKDIGKNTYTVYSYELGEEKSMYLEMEQELHNAIENGELELYYQPQVDISNGKIIGFESLIRWNHPRKGLVLPLRFIPLAEETGLIHNIGEWAIKTACTQGKVWHDMGFNDIKIGVNISGHQLKKEGFVSHIKDILKETGFSPHYLDLEITETVSMEIREELILKLTELRKFGVKVSIDDFGTGYSSLSYLREFPIDTLKIPREFIKDLEIVDNKNIIESIIFIAQKLGLYIIAEGVENEEQLSFFKTKQDVYVQGYFYSKPVPYKHCEELLKNGSFKTEKAIG